jgi:hypothetical protein
MALDDGPAAMTPYEQQLQGLTERFPGTEARPWPGALGLISIPRLCLPTGWNRSETPIWFAAPSGYPYANPDCFWADPELRLTDERVPQNAQVQQLDGVGPVLWFSWHLNGAWRPNKDTLNSWVAVIASRFDQRQ